MVNASSSGGSGNVRARNPLNGGIQPSLVKTKAVGYKKFLENNV